MEFIEIRAVDADVLSSLLPVPPQLFVRVAGELLVKAQRSCFVFYHELCDEALHPTLPALSFILYPGDWAGRKKFLTRREIWWQRSTACVCLSASVLRLPRASVTWWKSQQDIGRQKTWLQSHGVVATVPEIRFLVMVGVSSHAVHHSEQEHHLKTQ